ncbi:MAG: hypothetical protein J6Z22_06550 [Lachnospiraceae bacterium]|nr:hypothetical protein [Lachnospiraceae bacterium]
MDKVEKLREAALEQGRRFGDKLWEIKEITKLKSQICSCEEIIRKNQMEIGKMVYADYEAWQEAVESGEAPEEVFRGRTECEKQCVAIANANKAIAELKKQIKNLKKPTA